MMFRIRTLFASAVFLTTALSLCAAEQTEVAPLLARAKRSFDQRDLRTALALFIEYRDSIKGTEERQEWFSTTFQIIRCNKGLGHNNDANQQFFLLCHLEPLMPPLELMSLPWAGTSGILDSSAIEKTAEDWLKKPSIGGQFLAAAILSASAQPQRQSQGLSTLTQLSRTSFSDDAKQTAEQKYHRHVAVLASALLWKQRIPTIRSPNELAPLRNVLTMIPEPCQAGPLLLLGRAEAQAGEDEQAVLHWMRIPILFPDESPLAVEALESAAKSLEKLGRGDQAAGLRRERAALLEKIRPTR